MVVVDVLQDDEELEQVVVNAVLVPIRSRNKQLQRLVVRSQHLGMGL